MLEILATIAITSHVFERGMIHDIVIQQGYKTLEFFWHLKVSYKNHPVQTARLAENIKVQASIILFTLFSGENDTQNLDFWHSNLSLLKIPRTHCAHGRELLQVCKRNERKHLGLIFNIPDFLKCWNICKDNCSGVSNIDFPLRHFQGVLTDPT